MQISSETIGVSEWIHDSSITPSSQRNRQYVVTLFEGANRASMSQILADIKADKVTVYSACKRFVDDMRKSRSPLTVYVYRSMITGLFESVLGEENLRRRVMDRLVPTGAVYVSRVKKAPTREQLVSMLKTANPQYRALLGVLAVSGMRIGEALSRKMSDLEIRPEGYARVRLQAFETKGRYRRYSFLTREIVDWLRIHQANHQSEYLFGGEKHGHLQYTPSENAIKDLYVKVGLKDAPDKSEIYCVHSLRTFADSQMSKCGLDRKYIAAIIGHKSALASEASYLDWSEIENAWNEHCSEKMTWFDTKAQVETLERKNSLLERLLELTDFQREKLFALLRKES